MKPMLQGQIDTRTTRRTEDFGWPGKLELSRASLVGARWNCFTESGGLRAEERYAGARPPLEPRTDDISDRSRGRQRQREAPTALAAPRC